ncbi:hypothetical protein F4678DRAFT_443740 [Xylaria arbuscula]|nr:hypothetical protein F4678DRAFT_443740 [Xylaria arbuscula]
MQQAPLALSDDEDDDDDDDGGELRGRALRQGQVKKQITVVKGNEVFQVERIGDFDNADTTAFIKRAIHEEAEDREDQIVAIQEWEELGGADLLPETDDGDDGGEVADPPDPMAIDSPTERRRQIDGFRAELEHLVRGVRRADLVLGSGPQARFASGLRRSPEFALNNERRRAYKRLTRMSHLIGLDEEHEVHSY